MGLKFLEANVPPILDQVVDPTRMFRLTDVWRLWFGRLSEALNSVPNLLNVVTLTDQSASIAATDFSNTSLLAGEYRASYQVQLTLAATTSSSIQVAFTWVDGGITQTATGSILIGNTLTTGESDSILIHVDKGTAVKYSTTYGSVGATSMQYSLHTSLEKVKT
jgi:hypothetical protein